MNRDKLFSIKNRQGFTLIELLIAFAITSLIVSVLYGSFFVTERAVRTTDATMLKLHEMRATVEVMRKEIEAALPPASGVKADSRDAFVIEDRDFYGVPASSLGLSTFRSPLGGEMKVQYYIEEKDKRLILYKKACRPWENIDDAKAAEVIEDIKSFGVEARYDTKWFKTWTEGKLPNRVRVRLTAPVGGREITLESTVRPMIGNAI